MARGYQTIVSGLFAKEQVDARPEGSFSPAGMEQAIEKNWAILKSKAEKEGSSRFNGALLGLSSFSTTENNLILGLQTTDFKTFSYTNSPGNSLGGGQRADALGNSVLLLTQDNQLVLGKRSDQVFRDKGKYHCIGGHLEVAAPFEGRIDTFSAILKEITEELEILEEQVGDLVCLGLLRDSRTQQPEQVFFRQVVDANGGVKDERN